MYWISAPTTARAIWNFCSAVSDSGSSETIRLCSLAKRVVTASSEAFSFARTSPDTAASSGVIARAPSSSIVGAVATSPRSLATGR